MLKRRLYSRGYYDDDDNSVGSGMAAPIATLAAGTGASILGANVLGDAAGKEAASKLAVGVKGAGSVLDHGADFAKFKSDKLVSKALKSKHGKQLESFLRKYLPGELVDFEKQNLKDRTKKYIDKARDIIKGQGNNLVEKYGQEKAKKVKNKYLKLGLAGTGLLTAGVGLLGGRNKSKNREDYYDY